MAAFAVKPMTLISAVVLLLFLYSVSAGAAQAPVQGTPAAGAYFIRGELRDADGNPAPGTFVCTVSGGYRTCVPTDSNGRFSLHVNGEGRYEVIPGNVPTRPATGMFTAIDEYPAVRSGQEVSLDSAHREASIVLTLPAKNPELLLKVVDDKTQLPVELLVVQVCYADQMLRCVGLFFRSDSGEYRIHVPPQDFNLGVRSPDYEEWASFDNKGMKPGSAQAVRVVMRRLPEARDIALHEQEKKAGVNLPAPVQLAPAENEKLIGTRRPTTLRWGEVKGAVRYEVEVDYCQNSPDPKQCLRPSPLINVFTSLGKPPKPNSTEDTSLTFDFIGAQPGRWRVWAVDADGLKGFKSPWRLFIHAR